jgi:DNA replication protein DnaC
MAPNRPIEEWGKLVGDIPAAATAILDRFLLHAEIINIPGRSYRLKDRAAPTSAVDNDPN